MSSSTILIETILGGCDDADLAPYVGVDLPRMPAVADALCRAVLYQAA